MKKDRLLSKMKYLPLAAALLILCVTALADVCIPGTTTVIEAEAFLNDTSLTGSLELPDGVQVIGPRAFEGCTGLTGTLVIPRGVTTIGSRAFAGCTGLTGVVYIPPTVTFWAKDAFDGTSLKILDASTPGGDVTTDTDLPATDTDLPATSTDLPAGLEYEITDEGAVITGYTGAEEAAISIPAVIEGKPVVAIGNGAFQDQYGLTGTLVLPSTVRRIGDSAFYGCSSLTGGLTLPSGLTEIGAFAFCDCYGLTGDLNIPVSVRTVGESAFAFCEGLEGSLTLPSSVSLGARCFQGAGLTGSITIPASVKLGANVFTGTALDVTYEAPGFTWIQYGDLATITGWNGAVDQGLTIPAQLDGCTVTAIASEAFADIGLCGKVTIPGSVAGVGESAFRSNPGITELSIEEGVQVISAYAFADCTGLTGTVTLPASIVFVDETAFSGTGVTIAQ